jgi:predicted RNA binding protein YcfA (HicA-like mRNA interferase family)
VFSQEKRVNFTEEESWGVSHITKRKLMEVADQEVEVVLLDTIVKEDVLLLKVDTEGYEAMVIGGSHNVLKNHNVQNVVVEVKNFNEHDVRDFLFDLKGSGHFTHVYNYLEEYFKPMDLSVFSLDQATMYDVTDIVANKRYEEELKHEDFWFCKEPFKSLNV